MVRGEGLGWLIRKVSGEQEAVSRISDDFATPHLPGARPSARRRNGASERAECTPGSAWGLVGFMWGLSEKGN